MLFMRWMRSCKTCCGFVPRNNTSYTVDEAFPAAPRPKPPLNRIRELAYRKAVLLGRWLSSRRFAVSCPCETMSVARLISSAWLQSGLIWQFPRGMHDMHDITSSCWTRCVCVCACVYVNSIPYWLPQRADDLIKSFLVTFCISLQFKINCDHQL